MSEILNNGEIPSYPLTEREKNLLNRIKEQIYHEDSMVIGIVWGAVGSGKSVKAMHWAHYVDPSLNIERVCFDKPEFINAVINNKQKSIVGDEGIALFFSRAAMTKEAREVNELMAQCRQNNHFLLICVPNLLSVDKLVLDAANFVAYVWESRREKNGRKVTVKGNVACYPRTRKVDLVAYMVRYLQMKRSNPMAKMKRPEPAFIAAGCPIGPTFKEPFYPPGKREYLAKKESVLKKYDKKVTTIVKDEKINLGRLKGQWKSKGIRDRIKMALKENPLQSKSEIGRRFCISPKHASRLVDDIKEEFQKASPLAGARLI